MHTEKNVAESLFHTILNIPDKMKDKLKLEPINREFVIDHVWTWSLPQAVEKTGSSQMLTLSLNRQKKGSTYLAETHFEVHRWLCIEYK